MVFQHGNNIKLTLVLRKGQISHCVTVVEIELLLILENELIRRSQLLDQRNHTLSIVIALMIMDNYFILQARDCH